MWLLSLRYAHLLRAFGDTPHNSESVHTPIDLQWSYSRARIALRPGPHPDLFTSCWYTAPALCHSDLFLGGDQTVATIEAVSPLHERILAAVGDRTYRRVGELTGTHPETVRRYLQGQSPSVDFVMALCGALSISGQWLLTGEGPMRAADAKQHALQNANPGELLSAIAGTLDKLTVRLDRLELFVQGLEVRVRARSAVQAELLDGSAATAQGTQADPRARAIGDALAERSSEAAG